ncbi:integrating conjugative element protein [Shewanella colwelliana]|uniref:integrating conjugative element protein n=1 Tax=Shewanella colwelliana TaxID=23 RepID=UPI00373589C0
MNKHIHSLLLMTSLFFCTGVYASIDDYSQMLPVITPQLTPGKIKFTTTNKVTTAQLPRPLFIVGDDALSHKWLTHYEQKLKSLNAIGIIVNVKTVQGLNRFKQYSLQMYPVQAHDFANTFSIKHYPVLINDGKLSQ